MKCDPRIAWFSFAVGMLLLAHVPNTQAELTVIKDAEGEQGLTVHRMTVTPAAEPVPALKHRFVVPMHLRKPGNAATHYLRAFGELSPNDRWRRITDKYGEQVYDWYGYDFPVNELPLEEFREIAPMFQELADDFIAPASRCRECDWGLHEMDLRGTETITYRLSEAQETRSIARGLTFVSRLAIIDRRFDDAIELIRMNYQLGQDIGKQRFLVSNLVGMAEVGMANQSVIELIAAAESPNLYWALTELPSPILDLREAMGLEMSLGLRMFPVLLGVEHKVHTPEEWTRLLTSSIGELDANLEILGDARLPQQETLARLSVTGLSVLLYPAAKGRLIDAGMPTADVETMPVAQVLLIDTAREFQKVADEYEKWTFLPYREMREIELSEFKLTDGLGRLLADLLLPAVQATRTAQARTGWQINALRTIEALRIHAAAHGQFPASLTEIEAVPVPENPITGEPYVYLLEGETAILELPFSDGMPGMSWRFEIELAKN